MTYEITEMEIHMKYVICHDIDVKFVFIVTIEPIRLYVSIFVIREESMDSMCTIIRVSYETNTGVQVTLTWI